MVIVSRIMLQCDGGICFLSGVGQSKVLDEFSLNNT